MSEIQTDYRTKVIISWITLYYAISALQVEDALSLLDLLLAYLYPKHVKEEP